MKKAGFNSKKTSKKVISSTNITDITEVQSNTAWAIVSDEDYPYTCKHVTAQYNGLGIKCDGTLWGWGLNSYGTLGIFHDRVIVKSPVQIGKDNTWRSIDTNGWRPISAGIKNDGSLWSWGYTDSTGTTDGSENIIANGLNDGNYISRWFDWFNHVPAYVSTGLTCDWKSVSVGGDELAALKCDGSIWSTSFFFPGNGINSCGYCSNVRTMVQIAQPDYVLITNTELIEYSVGGRDSLTLLGAGDITYTGDYDFPDSGFWEIDLPWNFVISEKTYDKIIVSTDSYVLFKNSANTTLFDGNAEDFLFNTNMFYGYPKIYMGAADRSADRIYYGIEGISPNRTFRLRYEGYNTWTGGDPESPERAWEIILHENDHQRVDTQLDSNTAITLLDNSQWLITDEAIEISGILGESFRFNGANLVSNSGQPVYKTLETKNKTTFAIKTDGTLWAWGRNRCGSAGVGFNKECILTPTEIAGGGSNWKIVKASRSDDYYSPFTSSLALKTDGTLWGWGWNREYNLGTGDNLNRRSPVQTAIGGTDWKRISPGFDASKAIKCDGTLWGWGRNSRNSLAYCKNIMIKKPYSTIAKTPIELEQTKGSIWSAVYTQGQPTRAARPSYQPYCYCNCEYNGPVNPSNAAIKNDGSKWVWGSNNCSKLGIGEIPDAYEDCFCAIDYTCIAPPLKAHGCAQWPTQANICDNNGFPIRKIVTIDDICFRCSTGTIKADGTLWVWGYHSCGSSGTGANGIFRSPVQTSVGGSNWKSISGSRSTFVALKTDGTVWTWGQRGDVGSSTTPTSSTLVNSGKCWNQVVAVGGSRLGLIESNGELWTVGCGLFGVLGNNSTASTSSPVQTVSGGTDWRFIAGSGQPAASISALNQFGSIAAIKNDGSLWLWGSNAKGQLGDGTTIDKSSPVQTTAGGTDWKNVDIASFHALRISPAYCRCIMGTQAIKTDGSFWSWGAASNPTDLRLKESSSAFSCVPVKNNLFSCSVSWKEISFARFQSLNTVGSIIDTDNNLWTIGYGRCRADTGLAGFSGTPFPICIASNVTQSSGSAAIKENGDLFVWGLNASGEAGINKTCVYQFFSNTSVYETEERFSDFSEKFIGAEQFSKSGLWGVGWSYGQGRFGNGCTSNLCVLTQLNPSFCWESISSYGRSAAGIKSDGSLWAWGCNYYGKLGINDGINVRKEFTQVGDCYNWSQISVGWRHASAIKCDGTLWSWGSFQNGQNGLNVGSTIYVPTQVDSNCWIAVSSEFNGGMAIRSDRTLWMWGSGNGGRLGTNDTITQSSPVQTVAGGTNWCAISARGGNRAAIKTDGTMWLTGWNYYGQLGANYRTTGGGVSSPIQTIASQTNWKQVSTYYAGIRAIKTDGTLWLTGANYKGQLGTGDFLPRSSPVQTIAGGTNWRCVLEGAYNVFALKTDSTLWGWGYNMCAACTGNYTTFGKCFSDNCVTSPIQMDNNIRGFWKTGAGGMFNTFLGIFESDADDL